MHERLTRMPLQLAFRRRLRYYALDWFAQVINLPTVIELSRVADMTEDKGQSV
jgi:hypothetical protein